MAAHECARKNPAGVEKAGYGSGLEAGERLFEAILHGSHGVEITHDEDDASWQRLPGDRINLNVPELLAAVAALRDRTVPQQDPDWPFVLSAGERRAFTANTIMRDPTWRRRDPDGRLRISTTDATRLGVATGDQVRLTTRRGSTEVSVDVTDSMRSGHISLPNGLGLTVRERTGVAPNELTAAEDRDEWAGTPWHKHVAARLEPLGSAG
jgi:anaerobic selenocysteine-containing dehydrogenase